MKRARRQMFSLVGKYYLLYNHDMKFNVWNLILAVFLPPAAVYVAVGPTQQFWLNILLTLFGYVPGLVHAMFIILVQSQDNS